MPFIVVESVIVNREKGRTGKSQCLYNGIGHVLVNAFLCSRVAGCFSPSLASASDTLNARRKGQDTNRRDAREEL